MDDASRDLGEGIRYPFPDPPARGAAVEIEPGILWMRLPLPMALDHVNIFAFDEPEGWTVIDTGFNSRLSRGIWQDLLAGPLGGRPVARVLVTHHHPDHMGLAGWLQTEFGAELVTTRTAWLFSRMLQLDEQALPTQQALTHWRRAGMAPEILAQRMQERPFNFADVVAPMPLGFTRIADGDQITLGGRSWIVRTGGGHAPEQATLWCEDAPLVLGGDQLLPSISPNIGVYATEPEADPLTDWFESCAKFQPFAREDHLVLPGHKLPFTGLPARLIQLIDNHIGALERLRDHLRKSPATACDCFMPLFKRDIRGGEYGHALVEAVAHLNYLHRKGEVARDLQEDGAWLWRLV
ncbi:MAG: MBL fold metallo-hydrolase [Mangrovicoccus sp.]